MPPFYHSLIPEDCGSLLKCYVYFSIYVAFKFRVVCVLVMLKGHVWLYLRSLLVLCYCCFLKSIGGEACIQVTVIILHNWKSLSSEGILK